VEEKAKEEKKKAEKEAKKLERKGEKEAARIKEASLSKMNKAVKIVVDEILR